MSIFQKPTAPGGESAGGKFKMKLSNEPKEENQPCISVRLPNGKAISYPANALTATPHGIVLKMKNATSESDVAIINMTNGVIVESVEGLDQELSDAEMESAATSILMAQQKRDLTIQIENVQSEGYALKRYIDSKLFSQKLLVSALILTATALICLAFFKH